MFRCARLRAPENPRAAALAFRRGPHLNGALHPSIRSGSRALAWSPSERLDETMKSSASLDQAKNAGKALSHPDLRASTVDVFAIARLRLRRSH